MNWIEKACVTVRHSPGLRRADGLWNLARPVYDAAVKACGGRGLARVINGTDRVLIRPEFRAVTEVYEPDVWRHLMQHVKPGDAVVDVGAFIGLYAVALAKRVGPEGRVTAFEPDEHNARMVAEHFALNGVGAVARIVQAAVGARDGEILFTANKGIQNQIVPEGTAGALSVPLVRLDSQFNEHRVDLLKVDVEGFEEEVLKGATELLNDPARAPRLIYVEVHPYNWHLCGTTSESLLARLRRHGYAVEHMDGQPASRIEHYGEVVARRC